MLLFRSWFVLSGEYDRNNVRFQGDMRAQQEMYDLFLCSLNCNILMETLLHLWPRDGRIFVAGGKSNHLHLWCLESKQLVRIIQMPTEVRAVRHLEFLPDSFDGGSNQVSYLQTWEWMFDYLIQHVYFRGFLKTVGRWAPAMPKERCCAKYLFCCSSSLMEWHFLIWYFSFDIDSIID